MTLGSIDVETYELNEKTGKLEPNLNNPENFTIGCIILGNRKKPRYFYTAEEMWEYLIKLSEKAKKEGHNYYIYGHNHLFDLSRYGRGHLHDKRLRILTSKPLFAILNDHVYLLDTMAFLQGEASKKLEEVGEMLKIPKLKMPMEVEKADDLKVYLYRDTEIVIKFVEEIGKTMRHLGVKTKKILTAGNLAMTYFKTMVRDRLKYKNIPYASYLYAERGTMHQTKHNEFIRKAFRGARVECFKAGHYKNVQMIDINSLYPYVMANYDYPDPISERRIINPEAIHTREEILDMMGIAKATIQFPDTEIGYLATKGRSGRGIYFPRGTEVQGYWTIFELRRAVEEGYEIKEIHEIVTYRPLPFNPFKEIIDGMYKLRMESDGVFNKIIKLLMNSLGLKFSQYRAKIERVVCKREEVEEYEKQGFTKIEADSGIDYFMVKEGERETPKYANPIFSIYITAYARDVLYRNLKKISFENLIYCDTDAVAFQGKEELNKFSIGQGLGEFKIEFKDAEGEFTKEKTYYIKDAEHEKKVSSGATNRNLTEGQIKGEEEIINKKMYSYNMGFATGHLEKVGSFFEVKTKINPLIRKRLIKFPAYFSEDEVEQK